MFTQRGCRHWRARLGRIGFSLVLATAACGDSSEADDDRSILGTWNLHDAVDQDGFAPLRRVPFCVGVSVGDTVCTTSGHVRFESDGRGSSSVERLVILHVDGVRTEQAHDFSMDFSWTQQGSEIRINDDPEEGILRIEGASLKLYIDSDSDGSFEYPLASYAR